MLPWLRCYTASPENYLLHEVLTARFEMYTPFHHYSHYPNWILSLPAKTPVCAQLAGHCQPVQMASAWLSHHVASLDSLRQKGSFHHSSLHPCMANTNTHMQIRFKNRHMRTQCDEDKWQQGHFCLEWQIRVLTNHKLAHSLYCDTYPCMKKLIVYIIFYISQTVIYTFSHSYIFKTVYFWYDDLHL